MTDAEFKFKVFEIMVRRNLTVRDAAHAAGVSLPIVRRWLAGISVPHPAMWKVALQALEEFQNGR